MSSAFKEDSESTLMKLRSFILSDSEILKKVEISRKIVYKQPPVRRDLAS